MTKNTPRLPFLITRHNTYLSLTPNYLHPSLLSKKKKRKYVKNIAQNKCSIRKRNSRIIQIGHACKWQTFITLTFSPQYYWPDYNIIQKYFRAFIKSLNYYHKGFKYLAVLEHGGSTARIHYHVLTTITFDAKIFEHAFHTKRKVCNVWDYGFSDVVRVQNDNCNAVYYLCKYLGKSDVNRPPVGKREVFSSKGLNKIEKTVVYEPFSYLVNYQRYANLSRSIIFIKKKEIKNA